TAPFMIARAVCRFGRQTRLVLLFAWLTLWPTERVLPQISQARAIAVVLLACPGPRSQPRARDPRLVTMQRCDVKCPSSEAATPAGPEGRSASPPRAPRAIGRPLSAGARSPRSR